MKRAVDAAVASVVVACALVILAATRAVPRRRRKGGKVLLVFNTFYSLKVLRERGTMHTITHRDLDGYFDHVWSIHPLVGADDPSAFAGAPSVTRLGPRHTVIEGRVARSVSLKAFPRLNFALAQSELLIRVSWLIAREQVGIIRAWEPFYTGLVSVALGRLHAVPVELRIPSHFDRIYEDVGDLAFPKLLPSRRLEQAVSRFSLRHADQVVVLSEDNREYAINNGASEERTSQLGSWSLIDPVHMVQPDERGPVADFGLGDRPFVVAVTRLERVKYPQDVLLALARARVDFPELGGLLIGDGSMRDELDELARELGLDGHLIFIRNLDVLELSRAITSAAVAYVLIAGLALREAALSGTPIVAYDYEWHSEFVVPEETGILVP
ncbi:MAG: glycosyltransferase, partial [Actinobacteria bacterium]|nr:glycosyltransferase [Actinomycetota bacterium]